MRKSALILVLAGLPALAAAQTSPSAQPETHGNAGLTVQHNVSARIPDGFSVATRARLEAMIETARRKSLPTEPMTDRMAEGQAKGASEAEIVSASAATMGQLDASQQALIRAGRDDPSQEEVARGAQIIARGATSAQLESLVRQAPSDRHLQIAFEVVTQLAARGLPVGQALTMIGGNLSAGASDGQMVSVLGSANGQAGLQIGLIRKP